MRPPAAVILSVLGLVAQQAPAPTQPPRDVVRRPAPAAPVGTGIIRGRVLAADTGNPIRRATVNVSTVTPPTPAGAPAGRGSVGTPGATAGSAIVTPTMMQGRGSGPTIQGSLSISIARPRQATTDAQGGYEITGLPAGGYRIMASPGQYSPQYLTMAYGAKKPNGPFSSDPGQTIQLSDGQTFDKAVIALPRGAVIAGRVTDETGDALARIQVYTIFFPPGSARGQRSGANAQTDDLGQFRLFGLQTGEYAVVADARGNTYVPPNAPPETEEDKIGYMTTYYPGTADEGGAQRVRARIGAETPGIEIRLVQGRLLHVSGAVTDSQGRALARGNGQLVRAGPSMGMFSNFGFSTDEQGQFQMRNIPPGSYRLVIREARPNAGNGPPPGPQSDPGEMAMVPLTLAGADVDNLMVMTTPGTTITGHVVFEQGPPTQTPGQMRVMTVPGNPDDTMGMVISQSALVTPELTFTLKGLMGEYLLRANAQGQFIKSISVGGQDITDTPREFKSNDRVTITFTSRVSTVEGDVADTRGAPTTGAGVIIFSEDKALWRTNSTRTRRTVVDPNGHFRITGLMAGRYFIAAVPRDLLNLPGDATLLEQLSKEATSVVLGDDEQRRVDLKSPENGGVQ